MCERLNKMQMEINELYKRLREEGRSAGHAQWIIGNYYLTGRNVEKDPDKAEEWFLKAWDHHFPGTAATERFLLKRWWNAFVKASYSNAKRLQRVLGEAELTASECNAYISLNVHNDAQATWLRSKVDEITQSFRKYTNGRFFEITVKIG